MTVYFVSGHLDLTAAEFEAHYAPRLREVLCAPCRFIVGDARGADALTQAFLHEAGARVTVFHMFQSPRNMQPGFDLVGGFESDEARDAAMTAASDYDIAWVRPGRERSGTAKNLARRVSPA